MLSNSHNPPPHGSISDFSFILMVEALCELNLYTTVACKKLRTDQAIQEFHSIHKIKLLQLMFVSDSLPRTDGQQLSFMLGVHLHLEHKASFSLTVNTYQDIIDWRYILCTIFNLKGHIWKECLRSLMNMKQIQITEERKTHRLLYFGLCICFRKMGEGCAKNCFILHSTSCSYWESYIHSYYMNSNRLYESLKVSEEEN